ncbi:MAG: hypothetical protein JXA57_06470 [Armatimonadetes bacterium]|nr:hypothetical protein [Armatimonadota bacterium]
MSLSRPAWLLVVVVGLTTALVSPLRDQARLQFIMLPRPGDAQREPARDPIVGWLAASSETALDFARARPEDPELVLAAALIASDRDAAVDALREVTSSDGHATAWAAYLDVLLEQTPLYYREEMAGIHPENTQGLASARRLIKEHSLCTVLPADQATPIVAAAQQWQQIEAENALPVALEAWALWGLHRDEEALEKWAAASALPMLSNHGSERARAVSQLLETMGIPAPEAILTARLKARAPSLELLQLCTLAANYAGYCAEVAGDEEEAVRCWQSSIELGEHAQKTADTVLGFQAGAGIARLGAVPVWSFWSDRTTGRRTRGRLGGRYFHGPYHELFADRYGEEADLELVRNLAQADSRVRMLQHLSTRVVPDDPYARATEFLIFGLLAALLAMAAAVILLFVRIVGSHGSRPKQQGVPDSSVVAAAVGILLAAAAAGVVLAVAPAFPVSPFLAPSFLQITFGVGLPLATLVVLCLVADRARRRRKTAGAFISALQPALLLTVILATLLYLGLGLVVVRSRAEFVRQWRQPGLTELQHVARTLGPPWRQPPVMPDAWESGPPSAPPRRGPR